jgi:hypothetical protein
VWSFSKKFPQCSEFTERHALWVESAYLSIHQEVVKHHYPTQSTTLTFSHSFAVFRRDAFDDKKKSVEILQNTLSAINYLSRAYVEGLPNDKREKINEILDTLISWGAPFDFQYPDVRAYPKRCRIVARTTRTHYSATCLLYPYSPSFSFFSGTSRMKTLQPLSSTRALRTISVGHVAGISSRGFSPSNISILRQDS